MLRTDSMLSFTTVSSRKPDKAVITAIVLIAVQSVEKVKQKCLAFSLICGIINMVMKGAENRKTRKTSDRICMYGRADTGRPSAQKNR